MEDKTSLPDADEREESLEQRFKYAARFEELLRRLQAPDVLDILRIYVATCLPLPRRTDRPQKPALVVKSPPAPI